ncbi:MULTISPECIES: CDP-glycerol glycerophosphotransferase family protein [unclassified Exiguobacterium]|uniref:CDP-glycerol glycerophosphotransferase family protein n=1 Tax=unclassified Exiguobacterium TaxID=2644629 RepID=UPI001BE5404D|nr:MULTISPECIES: CDP-glycerol glycerophosphotransferase family protein [unclassified Exiguobacterium]
MFEYKLNAVDFDSDESEILLTYEIIDLSARLNEYELKIYSNKDVKVYKGRLIKELNRVEFKLSIHDYIKFKGERRHFNALLFSVLNEKSTLGSLLKDKKKLDEKLRVFEVNDESFVLHGTSKRFLLYRINTSALSNENKISELSLNHNDEGLSNYLSLSLKFDNSIGEFSNIYLRHTKSGLKISADQIRNQADGAKLIRFNFGEATVVPEGYWHLFGESTSLGTTLIKMSSVTQFHEINETYLMQNPATIKINEELYKINPYRTKEFQYGFHFSKERVDGNIHQVLTSESKLCIDYIVDSMILEKNIPVSIELFNEFYNREIPVIFSSKITTNGHGIIQFEIGQDLVENIHQINMVGKSFGLNLCLKNKFNHQHFKLKLNSLIDINSANLYPKKEFFVNEEEHTLGVGIRKNGDVFLYTRILNNILGYDVHLKNDTLFISFKSDDLNVKNGSYVNNVFLVIGENKIKCDYLYNNGEINILIKLSNLLHVNIVATNRLVLEFRNQHNQSIYRNIKVMAPHQLATSFKEGIFYSEDNGVKSSLFVDVKHNDICIEQRKLKETEKKIYKYKFHIAKYLAKVSNLIFSNKHIWLIGENLGEVAQDNGFAFFEYCLNERKKPYTYYITKRDNKNMNQLFPYEKNLLYYDSFKHIYLYHKAEYAIVAHGLRDVIPSYMHNKFSSNPLPVIYLQHGIIAMKRLFFKKNSYNNQIKRFIVSSDHEKSIMTEKMGFEENQISVTGLARYDKLNDLSSESSQERIIFVMPTWREWLSNDRELFKKSSFYKNYVELLTNNKLNDVLKDNNTKLLFLPHFEIQKQYSDLFEFETQSNIVMVNPMEVSIGDMIRKSNALITDYSSVAFDYAYLNKPVLFFHFDLNDYLSKRGSYIDLQDDIFGKSYNNPSDLILGITDCIKNNFSIDMISEKKIEKYISYRDKNNSERVFESIMSLSDN